MRKDRRRKIDYCCSQCGLNHETRDLIRALSIRVIDEMEKSKAYLEFLKNNEFLTKEGYENALLNTEHDTSVEANERLKSMLIKIDKMEKELIKETGMSIDDLMDKFQRAARAPPKK